MYKGLYIHIPFCQKKCRYCDFPSFAGLDSLTDKYIDALLLESDSLKGEKFDTVFIGGGTPTQLSTLQISGLLKGISQKFELSSDCEFSCEANPGTVTEEKLEALRSGGVNRLSIGVQSFCDRELETIGRIHDSRTAIDTITLAKKYFDNINIDIMTALPGETMESLIETLDIGISLNPTHISCYSLILEEGTELHKMAQRGEISLPCEDEDREMYSMLCERLAKAGYEQYEISNFARAGFRCRHNLKYWNTEEYIGLGAAAHSFLGNKRFANVMDVREYILNPGKRSEETELTASDRMGEYCMMTLRTAHGIDIREFERRFGIGFDEVYKDIPEKFIRLGLMKKTPHGYSLTREGIDVSNSVMCEFLI